ncbi:MAG: nicotinamide riboside transporter PnuC [Gemmatimonadaceae bacterium]
MNPLEIAAVVFGIVSVWLSTRQHIASWPTAIVNVSLYFLVFRDAKLYADMGLQIIYLVLSIYGWYEWKFGGSGRTELPVSRTSRRTTVTLVLLGVLGVLVLGTILDRSTDAALPWVDSAAAVTSLCAQWMMTRKLLENWLVWIAVDVVYVAMFIYKELYLTAGLYAVFLALAVSGYLEWRQSWRARTSPALARVPA